MKYLSGTIYTRPIRKGFAIKIILSVLLFFLAFVRIPFHMFKPSSPGFPIETIVKVKGEILSRPTITQGGDTGFKILLLTVVNRRGWSAYITCDAYVIVKGIHAQKMVTGDIVDLESCCFVPSSNGKIKEKIKRRQSLFFKGELISLATPPGRIGNLKQKRKNLLLRINNRIDNLPYRSTKLFKALILGEKGDLDLDLKENIKLVGCSHLLALSGFHVSILITMIVIVFKRILGERKTLILIIPILMIYLFLAGLFPSLIRAVIMALVGSIMVLSHKRRDKIVILMISLFLQVFIFPQTVMTVSFLLSYGAIIGIFFYTPAVDRVLSRFVPICFSRLFSVSFGAQIVNIPFVFLIFSVIYPIGLIVQIIITPLITLFVWMGSFYIFFSLLPLFLPGVEFVLMLLGFCMEWLYILLSKLCGLFSTMSFLGIHSFAGCCIFFFVLLIPLLFISVTRWRDTIAYRNFNDRL